MYRYKWYHPLPIKTGLDVSEKNPGSHIKGHLKLQGEGNLKSQTFKRKV